MTDKKYTDEETKKALADWKYNLCVSCEEDDCERCVAHLLGHSLDLINRQQAEIERLKEEKLQVIVPLKNCGNSFMVKDAKTIRAEARIAVCF